MHIRFPGLDPIPILFEDRSVLAIDKPAGWMLIPGSWQRTRRNLQAAIDSSIRAGHFWAKSRNVKWLRHVHRLDAETSGILLFAKSKGALDVISGLFEDRRMEKVYLAVVEGTPAATEWECDLNIEPDPAEHGRVRTDPSKGKTAKTLFKVLETRKERTLIECRPITGRTHQIRVHLLAAGLPIVGDPMYGTSQAPIRGTHFPMGLRAVKLGFKNPFTKKEVFIKADRKAFLKAFGFEKENSDESGLSERTHRKNQNP